LLVSGHGGLTAFNFFRKTWNLQKKLHNSIKEQKLLRSGDHVLVGVSGGPDSIALLHLLNSLKYDLGFRITVAHINHGLRKSATLDQKFVEQTCKLLSLECLTVSVSIKKQKGSLEEIAREKRLAALLKLAKQKKAKVIALGHNQDDLAETVLMRILRGTGLLGLQGIRQKRPMEKVSIVRPLLSTTRKDIEAFLKKKGIRFRIDPTNKQTKFYRNKIRLKLLPLLESQYNLNIKHVLANLANSCSADVANKKFKQLVKTPSKDKLRIPLKGFLRESLSMQRMILRTAVVHLKGNTRRLTMDHIIELENLIHNKPYRSIVHLPQGLKGCKEKIYLTLSHDK